MGSFGRAKKYKLKISVLNKRSYNRRFWSRKINIVAFRSQVTVFCFEIKIGRIYILFKFFSSHLRHDSHTFGGPNKAKVRLWRHLGGQKKYKLKTSVLSKRSYNRRFWSKKINIVDFRSQVTVFCFEIKIG